MSKEENPPFQVAADTIAEATNSDVLFINASIYRPLAAEVRELCRNRRRRKNVTLILVTHGGDAGAAYRMARCLQDSYDHYSLFLTGYCKSAGTLLALGAYDLIVSDSGELGPLDVQMLKPDEIQRRQSGLTATAALSTLHEQAFNAFEHFFLNLVGKSNSTISTRTATHVAVQLTSGLFAHIYEHVDPMHVGEAGRALQVAVQYGELLQVGSGNSNRHALPQLTTGFASHDFVIDLTQIKALFKRVREPNSSEQALADVLGSFAVDPVEGGKHPIVAYLSTEDPGQQDQVLPDLTDATGVSNAPTHDERPDAPDSAANKGGATPAGEPKPTTSPHIAALGTLRKTGTRRSS